MFESRRQPLLSRRAFAGRMVKHLLFSAAIVSLALLIGILGYHFIAGFGWVDSLLNASMILGGMGPVGELKTDAAKLFASMYALFSGLVFIGISAMLAAPIIHRVLHCFHLDEQDMRDKS